MEYFVNTSSRKTVQNARVACREQGGILATPRTKADIEFISNNFDMDWLLIDGVSKVLENIIGFFKETPPKYYFENGSEFRFLEALPWETNRRGCRYLRCCLLIGKKQFKSDNTETPYRFLCQRQARVSDVTTVANVPELRNKVTRDEIDVIHRRMQDMATQLEALKNHVTVSNNTLVLDNNQDVHELHLSTGFNNSLRLHIGGKPTRMGFRVSLIVNGTEDIPFQLSADFSKRTVSRTSYIKGDWGAIDRYGGFPFDLNDYFSIVIRSDDMRFYVQINGQDFCSFDHRFKEIETITSIRVEGCIHDFEMLV